MQTKNINRSNAISNYYMKDSYLSFANTSFGNKLISLVGLPQPTPLIRYLAEQPVLHYKVLLGAYPGSQVVASLRDTLNAIEVTLLTHSSLIDGSQNITWQAGEKVNALVFDATSLQSSSASEALHTFFAQTVRSVKDNGRIIIIGRPPAECDSSSQSIAQRALEGLSRSLAKELKKAITVQLIYLQKGAENQLESSLRFLLSGKSCYVSGQVITVSKARTYSADNFDWSRPLAGKKVLVTGASQGIGMAIAEVMARDGAELICLDIPHLRSALYEVSNRLNGRSIALDLSTENAAEKIVVEAELDGGWDVIVHNAGITRDKTLANMKLDLWTSVINVNLSSQERINDALVNSGGLNNGGRIICVSSISGIAGNRGQTNYAFSKAGVIGMVESFAPRLIEKNITINAVAPGFIETDMTATIPFALRQAGRRLNSMNQGGLPVDVAETIAWFANPASNGLTANVVRVCGQSILGA
ncbi:MAG: 3-oxoacyl-[acyl-carrier protein] reductase [Arenicella sp.]|jgi:3-oxoacyl-[acyl-carrier protein] reductase